MSILREVLAEIEAELTATRGRRCAIAGCGKYVQRLDFCWAHVPRSGRDLPASERCRFPKCANRRARGDLCWSHVKQAQRGTMHPVGPRLTAKDMLRAAARRFVAARGEVETRRAEAALCHAAENWSLAVLRKGQTHRRKHPNPVQNRP